MQREVARSRREVEQGLQTKLMDSLAQRVPGDEQERLIAAVVARELDPYSAAAVLFEATTGELTPGKET